MGAMGKLASLFSTLEPYAFAALRIVSGLAFAVHGAQKVFGFLSTKAPPAFGTQLWLGGWIELLAGLLIGLGVLVRPAAFLASGTMAVAYVQFHWKLRWTEWMWLPSENKGELALLYCFLFLFVVAYGPGPLNLGARLGKRWE